MGKKLTLIEAIYRSNKKHNFKYNYELVKIYSGSEDKVPIKCPVKGHSVFWQTFHSHTMGRGCPSCGGRLKSNTVEFLKKCERMWPNLHKMFDMSGVVYINNYTKVTITCKNYGHGEWQITPTNFLGAHGCPKCKNNAASVRGRSNTFEFLKKAEKVWTRLYELFDVSKVDYLDSVSKVSIICRKKGHGVFKISPSNFLQGQGCCKCKSSKGERAVGEWLTENDILFEQPKRFNDLRSDKGRNLSYDFYLPKHNTLIEFDGEQHFKTARWPHTGLKTLKLVRRRDHIKTKYAKDNGYRLLRIKYTDFKNINSILLTFSE